MYRRRLLIRPCYRAAICKKRNCTVIFTAACWNAGFSLAMFLEKSDKKAVFIIAVSRAIFFDGFFLALAEQAGKTMLRLLCVPCVACLFMSKTS